MDYKSLAEQFLINTFELNKQKHQQVMDESMKGEHFVLYYLYNLNNNAVPSEISEIMGVSSARIAAVLNKLENKGLITREIDLKDRRRILVKLSTEGNKKAKEQRQLVMDKTIEVLKLLGEEDAKEFVRITSKLANLSLINLNNEWK